MVDESQAQGFKIGEAAVNRGLGIAARIGGNGSGTALSTALQSRECQQSVVLQLFQQ